MYKIEKDKCPAFVNELIDAINDEKLLKISREDRDDHLEFLETMKASAVQYAKMRAQWEFMNLDEKTDSDPVRTRLHDTFIRDLKIFLRHLARFNARAEKLLGEVESQDRKTTGDIACYITYTIAVSNR